MTRYRNLGGNSGISAYESGLDYIKVRFNDGGLYLYTYSSTGSGYIEKMKALAKRGVGLNSFIGRYVRKRYQSKLR